jgi:hypothetical protein
MAKARPSVQKRKNELKRLEKKQRKDSRKKQRDADRDDREAPEGDGDPDLAGINPGPQEAPLVDEDGFTIS